MSSGDINSFQRETPLDSARAFLSTWANREGATKEALLDACLKVHNQAAVAVLLEMPMPDEVPGSDMSLPDKVPDLDMPLPADYEENEDLTGLCKICMSAEIDCIITPCFHSAICLKCAPMCKDTCPVCRTPNIKVNKIFKS